MYMEYILQKQGISFLMMILLKHGHMVLFFLLPIKKSILRKLFYHSQKKR